MILLQQWLEDKSFVNWVKQLNKMDIVKWEEYLNEHPEHWETAKKGRIIVEGIDFQKIEDASNEGKESLISLWEKIEANRTRRNNNSVQKKNPTAVVRYLGRRWFAAASIAAVMLISSALYFQFLHSSEIIIATGYGEQNEVTLPDGSIVTLNANSKLTYTSQFSRKVELEGEAFFEITKKPETGEKFQVITPDLSVVVLGTSFNVNARNDQTKVFLEEGKVELEMDRAVDGRIEMAPGDEITYSRKHKKQTAKRKNVSVLENASWKEGALMFNKTSLVDALYDIEDIYGIHFIIESEGLREMEITGGIPIKDLKVTLETLKDIYEIQIRIEGERYFISK